MSLESELHVDLESGNFRKMETLTPEQHLRRIALMSVLFLTTALYLYLTFVVGAFREYAINIAFGLLQSVVLFAALAIFALSACHIVQSTRRLIGLRRQHG